MSLLLERGEAKANMLCSANLTALQKSCQVALFNAAAGGQAVAGPFFLTVRTSGTRGCLPL